jgi:hypothetical protein
MFSRVSSIQLSFPSYGITLILNSSLASNASLSFIPLQYTKYPVLDAKIFAHIIS